MKCLVTGGAGFIGSHMAEFLVRRAAAVRVFDNLCAGQKSNLAAVWKQIEFQRGDLRERRDVERAVKGIDYIFHEAALRSVPRSIDNPRASHDANATGTLNLLVAARDAKVRRLIYASSSSVYGDAR
ncbi:MAG TPA: NAD-dependent epimerase/dehydratase family protein, partial [Elusimicrobiota bacterium]|nr:NAD-dependent epimerase/dehydratase family protein [Elusimicrobiota bacterium]